MRFALLLPAAGSGERLGEAKPKALVDLGGVPLFVHSLKRFLESSDCIEAIVAAPVESLAEFEKVILQVVFDARVKLIVGGETRQDSVGRCLDAVSADCELVLVHDAARPFVKTELIQRVIAAVEGKSIAALPGIAVADTLKRTKPNSKIVSETISRSGMFAVQTPQAINRKSFVAAHQNARAELYQGTDDVELIERYGLGDVALVEGETGNFKITTAEDLLRAREKLLP